MPDNARSICWIGRMTRDATQSTGKSDAAKITSQLNKGLPNQRSAQALAAAVIATITINNSGQIFLDAYPVSLPELEARLRTQRALTPDFPVIVKGDSAVQYQKVMDVLDLLRRIDLPHVGLVTGKQQS